MFTARLETIDLAIEANNRAADRFEFLQESNYTYPEHRMSANEIGRTLQKVRGMVEAGDGKGLMEIARQAKLKYCKPELKEVKSATL